jgi:hypothetical protein
MYQATLSGVLALRHKTATTILLTFVLLIGLGAVALALGGDPQTLFTDNITATGTTLAVTEMEQELLDRLNAATTAIDAAIYGLGSSVNRQRPDCRPQSGRYA